MTARTMTTERRYYLAADKRQTYPLRFRLRKLGLRWQPDTRQWYALTEAARDEAAILLGVGLAEQPNAVDVQPDTAAVASWQDDSQQDSAASSSSSHAAASSHASSNGNGDAAAQLAAAVRSLAAGAMNEDRVRQLIAEGTADAVATVDTLAQQLAADIAAQLTALREQQPTRLIVELRDGDKLSARELPLTRHAALDNVLAAVAAGFRNILLVGPAGTGKTTLARQAADALQLSFSSISCSAGMSEGQLLGRLLPTGDAGRFEYARSPLVERYECGGMFLMDEVDAADANTLLVLNSALANGHMDVPNRIAAPTAQRHGQFVLIAAGNTWGTGADRQYVGRNQLDAAFNSRFAAAVIEVNYDVTLEAALADEDGAKLLREFHAVRTRVDAAKLRRVWGTRELIGALRWLRAGKSVTQALRTLTVGWTADEISKAGVP